MEVATVLQRHHFLTFHTMKVIDVSRRDHKPARNRKFNIYIYIDRYICITNYVHKVHIALLIALILTLSFKPLLPPPNSSSLMLLPSSPLFHTLTLTLSYSLPSLLQISIPSIPHQLALNPTIVPHHCPSLASSPSPLDLTSLLSHRIPLPHGPLVAGFCCTCAPGQAVTRSLCLHRSHWQSSFEQRWLMTMWRKEYLEKNPI